MPPSPIPTHRRVAVIALFFIGLAGLALLAVAIDWLWRDLGGCCAFGLRGFESLIGGALALAGLALVLWSVRVQYTVGHGTPVPRVATQRLVTTGPYAWSRNPMTLGALILYLGVGIGLGSGFVIALTGIVFTGLLRYIAVHETRELTQRFGEAYRAYCRRTPFLIPWRLSTPPRPVDEDTG